MSRELAVKVANIAFSGLLGAGLLTTGISTAASASPVPPSTPQTAQEAAIQYLESTGLSKQEAAHRIATQNQQAVTAHHLDTVLGSTGAGAYIDAASGELTVGVTDPAKIKLALANGAVKVQRVTHSSGQLSSIGSAVNRILRSVPGSSVGINPVKNRVEAHVPQDVALSAAQKTQLTAFGSALALDVSAGKAITTAGLAAYGGQEYGTPVPQQPGYWTVCSLGFPTKDAAGTVFNLTAGHCTAAIGSQATFKPISGSTTILGSYEKSNFPGTDFGSIRVNTSNISLQSQVDHWNGSFVDITGSTEAPVGGTSCKSGRTTQWTCGTIQAKNVTVNYQRENSTQVDTVNGLVKYNACTEGGDSGGSVLAGTQAQGMTSGGQGYQVQPGAAAVCGEKVGRPNVSYYQPISPALNAYGLTLLTK